MKALASIAFAAAGIHVGTHHVLPVGYAPCWNPDGGRLAYVTRGDLWVADADGTHRGLVARDADAPAWAPNGRRLAFSRGGWIWTVRADGADERRLARGAHPVWSPSGNRIAFDRTGRIRSVRWYGGDQRVIARGEQPAYSPGGRLAFVRENQIVVEGRVVADGDQPSWGPDGHRLAYVRHGRIYVAGHAVARGAQPDWRPAAKTRGLLPDLDQRAPSGLAIAHRSGRWLLGFTSLVDNIGLGPEVIVGVRNASEPWMRAAQIVPLANGAWRTYPRVGRLRYTNSAPHHHWHLLRFDSYELRSLAGAVIVRDRKSGFCLADHYGLAPGDFPRRPRFLGNCAQYDPGALRVVQGTSAGFTDRYLAFFHGQNVDITGVPGGDYDLVHRANPNLSLHELRYENDAASVRIRLTWRSGFPRVRILRRCPATATC